MEDSDLVWAMLGVGFAGVMLVAGLLLLLMRAEQVAQLPPVPAVVSFSGGFALAAADQSNEFAGSSSW